MAPKRRATFGGPSVPTRKRSTRRQSSSSSSSATQGASPPSPSSPHVDQLAGKTITTGRKVDFDFFASEGFSIGCQLKEMGWERVCSLDVPTYPALVREFYNGLCRGEGGLVSFVRGTKVIITAETLGNLLKMPTIGIDACQHDDRGGALSRMLGRDVSEFEEIFANQLNLELRLLHNICGRILFPKIGRFEYVSERDILLMDCIITGQPVNLAGMIIGYMAECATKKRSTLPYGMILTLVFRSQGVLIVDNEPLRKLRHTDYYSVSTIHRMGFRKVDGNWIKKGQEARAEEARVGDVPNPSVAGPSMAEPSEAGPSTHFSPPSQSAFVSDSFSVEQIGQLRALLAEFDNQRKEELNQLKEEFNQMKEDFKQIKEEISSRLDMISFTISSSADSFSTEIQKIFDRMEGIADGSGSYVHATSQLKKDIDLAVSQIEGCIDNFKKSQRDDIMELVGHLKKIVYKHI